MCVRLSGRRRRLWSWHSRISASSKTQCAGQCAKSAVTWQHGRHFFLTRVFPNGAFLNNFGGLHFGISSSFFLTYSLMSGNLQMSISPRGWIFANLSTNFGYRFIYWDPSFYNFFSYFFEDFHCRNCPHTVSPVHSFSLTFHLHLPSSFLLLLPAFPFSIFH